MLVAYVVILTYLHRQLSVPHLQLDVSDMDLHSLSITSPSRDDETSCIDDQSTGLLATLQSEKSASPYFVK